jgi:hypothetical protein
LLRVLLRGFPCKPEVLHPAVTDLAARWNAAPLAAQRDLIRGMCTVTARRQASTRVFDHGSIGVTWGGEAA